MRIIYHLPRPFLDFNYRGLRPPASYPGKPYSDDDLGFGSLEPMEFLKACATNYILRNFWHNFVHVKMQKIDRHNYHDFRGVMRFESDFEADTLSLLLLAASYDLPIKTNRFSVATPQEPILVMLRCNRCNDMFTIRAKARTNSGGNAEQSFAEFQEKEWRVRRTLAGYVSSWLLAQGVAATVVRVYMTGELRCANGKFTRSNPGLALSVNGIRISMKRGIPFGEQVDAVEMYNHRRQIAGFVYMAYSDELRGDKDLQRYAKQSVINAFRRLGVYGTSGVE